MTEIPNKALKGFPEKWLLLLGIVILTAVEFLLHRAIPFMMDDLWYSTNLATGEPLHGLGDIVESQVWHFWNWGGRCMTHGILQLTLMCPEWAADLLNTGMTLLLAAVICLAAGRKGPLWFLMAHSMLVSLNANWKMSMFWQSGLVNYVYSSVWILLFLWLYLRRLEDEEKSDPPGIFLWILPLGLLAGWSNENMGPSCFLLAAGTILLFWRQKKRVPLWMAEGAAGSLIGSVLLIAAPGNFVRSGTIAQKGLLASLWDRFYSMLTAGADFLFPSFVLLVSLLLFYRICAGKKLRTAQWALLAVAVISYGAMALSPHYPDRAAFGTMAVCVVLILSVLGDWIGEREEGKPYAAALTACSWFYALYTLLEGYFQGV